MCKCIEFTAQLAEKFPWNNMETEVDGKIFGEVFWTDEYENFWVRLNEVLELHKERNPLRCVEILDFIGRNANHRPNDVTLSHYKNSSLSPLSLQYLEEAVKQGLEISVFHCLIIMDIWFEAANQKNQTLFDKAVNVMQQLDTEKVVVKNQEAESEYFHAYSHLWRDRESYKSFTQRWGL